MKLSEFCKILSEIVTRQLGIFGNRES